ncbi:MAG: aminotransferase class V-fold PLP-dependent enzyme, partial [Candidatus Sericytochromatia bacterium]|nr:aminotransferase class V-fold PLP-dependent enzyme [Candidatus Sericytochromatia bacterium]
PEAGRQAVARLMGAAASEVSFMGGLRGSFQLTLMALAQGYPERKHVIIGPTEHPTWLQFVESQRRLGLRVTVAALDDRGQLDTAGMMAAIGPDTLLVSVGWVSPDTGAVAPIAELGAEVRRRGTFFHTNAAAGLGYLALDLTDMAVDLMTFSGPSIGGPERVGGLYVRGDTDLGGFVRQEARRYESVHGAALAGMGVAADLAGARFPDAIAALTRSRDRLEQTVMRLIPGVIRLGPPGAGRAPHLAAWAFEGIHAGALADWLGLAGFRLVPTALCERAQPLPLGIEALRLSPAHKFGTVTIGLPFGVADGLIDELAAAMQTAVTRLRQRSPVARHLLG